MSTTDWTRATTTGWTKATASGQGGQCVEMRATSADVEVRDSKDPHGPTLRLTTPGWNSWLAGARRGDLDRLSR